jgi:hypothetical protein
MTMRTAMAALLAGALLLAAAANAPAQGAATLYGYEKAPWVRGTVSFSPGGGEVSVTGFSTVYREPLTLLAARAFDPRGSIRLGELPAGFAGDTTFPLPAGAEGMDTVILLTASDPIPIGLGLLR